MVIIIIALALGLKFANESNSDEAWVFLSTIVTPLGMGFLILVASEIVYRLGRSPDNDGG